MKNINLTNLQVIEISHSDLQNITGGSWLLYAVGYVCGKIANAVDAYREGVEAASAANQAGGNVGY
jgi:hypothetical protein